MRRVLLDTDVCVDIIRGFGEGLAAYAEDSLLISSLTLFELLSGLRGRRSRKLENRAKAFLAEAHCLPFDDAAADASAKARIALENRGQKIGAYDTLIAGHALAIGAHLLTGNAGEFGRVKGLPLLAWK